MGEDNFLFFNSFLVHSFFLGIQVTIVYDIIRIFRRVFRHGGFLIGAEDLLFWIYTGTEIFVVLNRESDGVLRWYAVAGALAGMLLYRRLFSRFLVKNTVRGLTGIKKLTIYIAGVLHKSLRSVVGNVRKRLTRVRELFRIFHKK